MVSIPTGPPSYFSIIKFNKALSVVSSPNSSMFRISKDEFATSFVITPSNLIRAKSATLLTSLFAILGVPLERLAIASAPSSVI